MANLVDAWLKAVFCNGAVFAPEAGGDEKQPEKISRPEVGGTIDERIAHRWTAELFRPEADRSPYQVIVDRIVRQLYFEKGTEAADLEVYGSEAFLRCGNAADIQRRIIWRLIDKAGLRPAHSSGK